MVRVKARVTYASNASARDTDRDYWQEDAACGGAPLNLFFDMETQAEALIICGSCPVKNICLKTHKGDEFGVFGGMTASQRERKGFIEKTELQPADRRYIRVTSENEEAVIRLRAEGKTNPEIMLELNLTRSALARIIKKNGLQKDLAEAAKLGGQAQRVMPKRYNLEARTQIETLLLEGESIDRIIQSTGKSYSYIYGLRRKMSKAGRLAPLDKGTPDAPYDYAQISQLRDEGETWHRIGLKYNRGGEAVSKAYRNWKDGRARNADGDVL